MLFKSGVLASVSGSLGGFTASHNRGGMYLRGRSIPTNPNSTAQQTVRGIFASLSGLWADLTNAQRAAWTAYALASPVTGPLGDPLILTGHQMYIRCNSNRLRAGLARVDDGPVTAGLVDLGAATAVVTAATGVITVTFTDTDAWVDDDDGGLLVFNSRDIAPSKSYFRGPYRAAGFISGNSVTPPTSPDASLSSVFGHDASNNTAFRMVALDAEGRVSAVKFVGPTGNV